MRISGLTLMIGGLCAIATGQAETIRNFTGLNYWDEERAFEGYTLFGAQGNSTTYLLDMEGNVVHSWPISGNPRLLDNGNLFARDADGSFHEVDWDGNTIWSYRETRPNYVSHHDYVRAFNPKLGEPTTFYIANRDVSQEEYIALGCDPANDYTGAQIDTIVEVDMDGNIIWEWRFVDHLVQDRYPDKANYVGEGKTIADYPGRLNVNLPGRPVRRDWLHLNAMDYNQDLDQVMFDTVQGEVYIVDHGNTFVPGDPEASLALAAGPKGDLLYRFGDPARYEQGDPPRVLEDWTTSLARTQADRRRARHTMDRRRTAGRRQPPAVQQRPVSLRTHAAVLRIRDQSLPGCRRQRHRRLRQSARRGLHAVGVRRCQEHPQAAEKTCQTRSSGCTAPEAARTSSATSAPARNACPTATR